jgi:ATP-dependent protease HslVU (ClpYQ) ATPase subunit
MCDLLLLVPEAQTRLPLPVESEAYSAIDVANLMRHEQKALIPRTVQVAGLYHDAKQLSMHAKTQTVQFVRFSIASIAYSVAFRIKVPGPGRFHFC